MQLSPETNSTGNKIQAFKLGEVQINDTSYTHSLILSSETIITDWQPQHLSELTPASFKPILELKPQVILLGTGAKLCFPPSEIYHPIMAQGIGFEIMDTAAACRTFNILIAEDRNVVAGLML